MIKFIAAQYFWEQQKENIITACFEEDDTLAAGCFSPPFFFSPQVFITLPYFSSSSLFRLFVFNCLVLLLFSSSMLSLLQPKSCTLHASYPPHLISPLFFSCSSIFFYFLVIYTLFSLLCHLLPFLHLCPSKPYCPIWPFNSLNFLSNLFFCCILFFLTKFFPFKLFSIFPHLYRLFSVFPVFPSVPSLSLHQWFVCPCLHHCFLFAPLFFSPLLPSIISSLPS